MVFARLHKLPLVNYSFSVHLVKKNKIKKINTSNKVKPNVAIKRRITRYLVPELCDANKVKNDGGFFQSLKWKNSFHHLSGRTLLGYFPLAHSIPATAFLPEKQETPSLDMQPWFSDENCKLNHFPLWALWKLRQKNQNYHRNWLPVRGGGPEGGL